MGCLSAEERSGSIQLDPVFISCVGSKVEFYQRKMIDCSKELVCSHNF